MTIEKPAIIVENVWKQYGVEKPAFLNKIQNGIKRISLKGNQPQNILWALQNISFQVEKGETFGIIGRNGAGKSTILKLLSGVSNPTLGTIHMNGSIFPMIELNAGMHLDFTGRENVYVLGTIMGLSKQKINEIMGDIEDFCELGDWFDRPVRHYSSGMTARLGFSVGVNVNADIILIDEVLSVGDLSFALKCHRKISELREKGVTIIFVSHNLQIMKNICTRVMWIEYGVMKRIGEVNEVCDEYRSAMIEQTKKDSTDSQQIIQFDNTLEINVEIWDVNYSEKKIFKFNEPINIAIKYKSERVVNNPLLTINIYNSESICISSQYSFFDKINFSEIIGNGLFVYEIKNNYLNPGNYKISIIIAENDLQSNLIWHEKNYEFSIIDNSNSYGIINFSHEWYHYPNISAPTQKVLKRSIRKSFFSNLIQSGDLCFDIGANIGDITQVLLEIGARVIAIEPQNDCVSQIFEKFGHNPHLTVLKCAISSHEGTEELLICPSAPTISTLSQKWMTGRFKEFNWTEAEIVKVTTLDQLIEKFGVPKFCKIDVEGSEISVLSGLNKKIPIISFEFNSEFFDDAKKCLDILENIGYCEFNYSFYEKYVFESKKWLEAQEICSQIERNYHKLLWGDIYAKINHLC